MRRTATAAVLVCAVLLAMSIASPAFGGPSIGSIAKTATKALGTAKKADRNARSALRIARTGDGVGEIREVTSSTVTDATGVAAVKATCPSGWRVISGGHTVGALDTPASAQPYGHFYGVIAVNLVGSEAKVQATALCVRGIASASALNRRETRRFQTDLATARAAHSCSAGYKHAVTPGGHKCLRAGQYCSTKRGYAQVYKNKGFVCKNGRLRNR